MVTPQGVRRWVMTGAVAAITVTGSLYGAGLKADQEKQQIRRQIQEASPEEKIAQLEGTRAELVKKKAELERRMEAHMKRRKEHDEGIVSEPRGR
ncbi:hypothetical protein DM02DRAFT_513339 [Periconia macrospinosa]|uniref:Uncharacterized protein n=1 Tax=Periconia macrospinosa TaxID=97972 RepID=A0A2V1E9P2_9PLEO|nr:hypothetical protein DM02DRAFT_513339 [Periconia macrospinosa]